ncbi:hypothetical protein [Goodfellowiella coeruleoviolacea]|uniref:Uncharacterized protein n=1 Tax=Goodfellowiella coeruleoviolacea TaxID=334858 RepID=A0AAE3GII8_9PSEU|nr:hypothetical protein [Goodfellowiella coeruleoviolacea]MCP2168842.1 hypothetical protein [Goodfellowiella coeruleoviolacea]
MGCRERTNAEQSRHWVEAFAATVNATMAGLSRECRLTVVVHPPAVLQRELRGQPPGSRTSTLTVTCEESQGFLSIDRVRGISVLYEFEANPESPARRYAESGRRSTGKRSPLSEVDLVNHVVGFLLAGYRFLRVPLHEELRIPGFGATAELRWINLDISCPRFSSVAGGPLSSEAR